jgi:hypothetical protein
LLIGFQENLGAMKRIVADFLESLKKDKKLTAGELEAAFPNANLLKMQADPDQLIEVLRKLADELAKLSDADRKVADEALALLKSQSLDERVRGTEKIFDRLHNIFNDAARATGKPLSQKELVAQCLDRIGPDALRLNPAIEQLYQLYLARQRPKAPIAFEEWLKVSDSLRLPKILKLLLTSDQLSKLVPSAAVHSPAKANFVITQAVVDRIMALLASPDVDDKLLRKLSALLEDVPDGAKEIRQLLANGKLNKVPSQLEQKLFLITDLWNLQGNMGEILALPKQLERLKAVVAKHPKSRPIFLASDVRVGGRRIVVDKEAERAAAEAAEALGLPPSTTALASEVDVRSLEFSDDLIVDLGSPPRMTVIEHHESKVTRQSIADGVEQIGDNTERMEIATEISIGRLYKLENGELVTVKLDEIQGFDVVPGADGTPRMVISEGKDFVARAKKQDAAIEEEIKRIDNPDPEAKRKEIANVIARAAREELEHKNLLGIKSSQKVLFTPDAQPGDVPLHILPVPMGFTYIEIIDFCNLLLIQAAFRRFGVTGASP